MFRVARGVSVATALLFGHATAVAQPAIETVLDCDLLAAHPFDLQRVAEGVPDDRIVPRLAIRACEEAARGHPQEARFVFQLGRALLAAGRREESFQRFRTAADAGHAAAWGYVGDAYQFGHGVASNSQEAFAAYTRAMAGGFARAQALIDQLNFDRAQFTAPMLDALFNNRFADVRARTHSPSDDERWPHRAYLFSMTQKFISECGRILPADVIPRLYELRFGSGWSAENEGRVNVAILTAIGEYDGDTFVRRHGCEGPTARHVFNMVTAFLRTGLAP